MSFILLRILNVSSMAPWHLRLTSAVRPTSLRYAEIAGLSYVVILLLAFVELMLEILWGFAIIYQG